MKSFFYSILYAPIKIEIGEKLSVGMIAYSNNRVFFRYSIPKLHVVKHLIPEGSYEMLISCLREIDTKVNYQPINVMQILHSNYMSYLSAYSNNLLSFDEDTLIDIELTEENFNLIYEKFVTITKQQKDTKISFLKEKEDYLYEKISSMVNVHTELSIEQLPHLLHPTKVSFIGKNKVPVTGQFIDFEKREYNLINDLYAYQSLTNAIEKKHHKGIYFCIGNEPPKKKQKHHAIWQRIHKEKEMSFVSLEELDKIEHYLQTHNVEPYF